MELIAAGWRAGVSIRGVRVRPTRHGWVFALLLLAMLIGSANYNNNLGFAATFLLASMALASALEAAANLGGLRVGAASCEPVFAGSMARLDLVLDAGERPRRAVHVALPGGAPAMASAKPGVSAPLQLEFAAMRRGVLRPGAATAVSEYPLGLFEARTRLELPEDAVCLAYPAPLPGDPAFRREGDTVGGGGSGGPGVDDFRGVRSYAPGDPLNRVAWKSASRGRGLMTKEFEGTRGTGAVFSWDALPGLDGEIRLSRLTSMVLEAFSRGESFGLELPGLALPPGRGEAQRSRCLQALALFGEPEAPAAVGGSGRADG